MFLRTISLLRCSACGFDLSRLLSEIVFLKMKSWKLKIYNSVGLERDCGFFTLIMFLPYFGKAIARPKGVPGNGV